MRCRRRVRWVAGAVRHAAVVVAALCVGLLAGCTSSPVLLEEGLVPGGDSAEQNTARSIAPGWTWCEGLSPEQFVRGAVTGTRLEIYGTSIGATIVDRRAEGWTTQQVVDAMGEPADECLADQDPTGAGTTIEALGGLDDHVLGWRTEWRGLGRGEYAIVPLDEGRVLAVGFVTQDDEEPIALDELIAAAEQGAEQFPAEDG